MRAVLQRVLNASVTVNTQVSSIDRGLCILLGIAFDDTIDDLEYMVKKILKVRVFEDEKGEEMWSRSVKDAGLEILCVSQFTLYGSLSKNKPSFHNAMKANESKEMYSTFLNRLKQEYVEERIKDGVFGEKMIVNIVNDGPVTLELDSRKFIYVDKSISSSKSNNNKEEN
ncbi:D-tyrosyl-tRNA deacylase [Rhizophagus irregularis]|uniref:D-aminoacyl-tRNA deacylase n=1 Tax=Rhizophagus irregularis TaxID=588596 RepID=A0A2I1EFL0_9GLOM|nr:D-tyrosyl-tRNA deacylase [Rhizophagus irregularis]RGB38968.1 D-tyrosyl-tRNA deacylase [Rhizophagus diaphanus] [Rhizophagus sp. MUCL 43196]PKK68783.1 D-tyrosyl-tRNA deacylase [Rhizophagus irregularis]PKY20880.1 D-tyrosyl-tRNA deacylase [Rhizophagus irregularis]PKY51518.1 D-tyrosyl-tRNA deacylase [Rhizophagus irregularis]